MTWTTLHPTVSSAAALLLLASVFLGEAVAEWVETSKVEDVGGLSLDFFGRAVAIDNGVLVVGADGDDIDRTRSAGSATIFELVDGDWSAQAKLIASDFQAGDSFGYSVASSDGTVAVGAWMEGDGGDNAGAVYMYREESGSWTEHAKLVPTDIAAGDLFGWSISMQGDTLLVGAPGASSPGYIYVYTFLAGSWTEHAKLTSSDGFASDQFGFSVALSDATLVVGANGDGDLGARSGSAYVFQLEGEDGLWSEQAKLTPTDGTSGIWFGTVVAIEGGTVCIASRNEVDGTNIGAVYIFREEGDSWVEEAKLVASDFAPTERFSNSLALQDGLLVVGASGYESNTGAAFLFEEIGGFWTNQATLVASDGTAGDWFGFSVDVDDGVVIVSAHSDDGFKGSAYAFEWRRSRVGPIRRILCTIFSFLCRD